MSIAFPRSFFECRNAVVAARQRTGDTAIGTQVGEDGKVQVVRVTYPKKRGYGKVEPVSDWLAPEAAVAFLGEM